MRPVLAEALGTFWIVLIVAGLAAEGLVAPGLGMGAAAGLAYLSAALTLGQITTGHFHPGLTVGLRRAGGFGGSLSFTLLGQIAGAFLALLFVGPDPAMQRSDAPLSAMLLLVPLIALPILVHVAGMRLRAEAVAYANAVAIAAAVSLAPGGHASFSAAHATAAWVTGHGVPIALWQIWLATIVAVVVAGALWSALHPQSSQSAATEADEDDWDEDDLDLEDRWQRKPRERETERAAKETVVLTGPPRNRPTPGKPLRKRPTNGGRAPKNAPHRR